MSSHASDLRADSPSFSSFTKSLSYSHYAPPSTLRKIITAPPWASDEPPSPIEPSQPTSNTPSNTLNPRPSQSALSDSASTSNQTIQNPYGRKDDPLWWMFTPKRRDQGPPQASTSGEKRNWASLPLHSHLKSEGQNEKRDRPIKERSLSTWLPGQRIRQSKHAEGGNQYNLPDSPTDDEGEAYHRRSWGFHIPLPTTPAAITISQNRTPGWDTPWSERARRSLDDSGSHGSNVPSRQDSFANADGADDPPDGRKRSKWYRRRKRLRMFILSNTYVPLLFRVINITLTTAALAVAIKIRQKEKHYGVMGAVGASPTLVIIFAPPTLVHVLSAIYLEYFGRPLGLWRTSGKLFHTLSETFFICMWSAALSLCFDNFFTSMLNCVPESAMSWYNEIPRTMPDGYPNLGRGEGQPGDYICDSQVALICLVFLGLVMYCMNLFISLFRIIEKVKYHSNFHILPR
ncbi:hypothetical protein ACEPAI_607 [Sanghuangporus weigelae]